MSASAEEHRVQVHDDTGLDKDAADSSGAPDQRSVSRRLRWLPWLAGAAMLGAVVAVAAHLAEGREFVRIAERSEPWWMLAALTLQALTYLAEAQIWRGTSRAAGFPLSLGTAYRLSLTKLFIDQALPSAGISGTVVVARSLQERGMSRPAVMAGVIIDSASYHATYVVCLAVALGISLVHHQASRLVELVAAAFGLFAIALVTALLTLSGRGKSNFTKKLGKLCVLRRILGFLADADPRLARSPRLLSRAAGYQLAIFVLDAATVWLLIEALGATAGILGVFASFMISTLFRTLGVLPGGLGTFEASSVLTLHLIGVDLAVALSATLLFRGLSFWLPMVPGLWLSRGALGGRSGRHPPATIDKFWALDPETLLSRLTSSTSGLSTEEALRRREIYGKNELREQQRLSRLRVLWNQIKSPLLLLLFFAAAVSSATGEWTDALIVGVIVLATVGIGYRREYSAQVAALALRARVKTRSTVMRDGQPVDCLVEDVVPGDVVLLSAGSLVPADGIVLEAMDCYVSEAVLTGESFPVEKGPGVSAESTSLGKRSSSVFLGTNVRSGTARCLIVATGRSTAFGAIAHRLALKPPEAEFDRGLRRFGYLLTSAMLVMVLLVFVAHMFRDRPPVETLLFSIALAVGLSPELLPAILGVNLSRGAEKMAKHGVLVRRLNAIENLGSMDILCTDKTGTLTTGVVELEGAYDSTGAGSAEVLKLGAVNALLETGIPSPLDAAILEAHRPDSSGFCKRAEIPFDFVRKRVSVIVEREGRIVLITKGAFQHVVDDCTALANGQRLSGELRGSLTRCYEDWSRRGIRVLAVATRHLADQPSYGRGDEKDLAFVGFLTFVDRPKKGSAEALAELAKLGVSVKLITGDSKLVAQYVAGQVGLSASRVLTGQQLDELHDEALWREAERTDLFVEVDPNQKERIILSLKKMGHVVGFLGDGVNDAPAMHAADTSLSVDQAVDVAREAADFVLLERNLDVIRQGVEEGRKTFANTLKYVLTTTSANLGNMVSMAVASLFLPFLPLLAGQILLNNFISDIPAVGIAGDSVDSELVDKPRRWNIRFIGRFMLEFGFLSSAFDFVTFGVLLGIFHASPELFRTGWFVESLLTELVIALVVRTRRAFFQSRPGRVLLVSTVILVPVAFAIPYLPQASVLGFVPVPPALVAALAGVTVLYVLGVELLKKWFYRREM